jgi:hypothetical protein
MEVCWNKPEDSPVQPVIPGQSRARADLKQTKQSASQGIQHWLKTGGAGVFGLNPHKSVVEVNLAA